MNGRRAIAWTNDDPVRQGPPLSSEFMQTSIVIRARVRIYIPVKQVDLFTHPFSKFKEELVRPPLKLKHELVLTVHIKLRMQQLIHIIIFVNLC